MTKFEEKVFNFSTALSDLYRDEESRESSLLPQMNITDEEITDDFTAMLYAMFVMYRQIADGGMDIIEFTHILNRLAIQHEFMDK